MSRKLVIGLCVVASLGVTSCVTNPSNRDVGSVLGAIVGGSIGSMTGSGNGTTAMIIIGGVAGWIIGGNIGSEMDRSDQDRAARVAHRSFEDPRAVIHEDHWKSRRGHRFETRVETGPRYSPGSNRLCKNFTQYTTIYINGRPKQAVNRGVACKEYDRERGKMIWRIQ